MLKGCLKFEKGRESERGQKNISRDGCSEKLKLIEPGSL